MQRSLVIASMAVVAGLASACTPMNTAYRLGSVTAVSDRDLQVCSDPEDTPPMAGQEVQLVRRERLRNPKFSSTIRERRVGTARVGTKASGRCVDATLVQGKARRHDQVYPAMGDAEPR